MPDVQRFRVTITEGGSERYVQRQGADRMEHDEGIKKNVADLDLLAQSAFQGGLLKESAVCRTTHLERMFVQHTTTGTCVCNENS